MMTIDKFGRQITKQTLDTHFSTPDLDGQLQHKQQVVLTLHTEVLKSPVSEYPLLEASGMLYYVNLLYTSTIRRVVIPDHIQMFINDTLFQGPGQQFRRFYKISFKNHPDKYIPFNKQLCFELLLELELEDGHLPLESWNVHPYPDGEPPTPPPSPTSVDGFSFTYVGGDA